MESFRPSSVRLFRQGLADSCRVRLAILAATRAGSGQAPRRDRLVPQTGSSLRIRGTVFPSSFSRPAISTFAVPDLARLMRCAHRGVLSPPARAHPCVRPGPRLPVHHAESLPVTRKGLRVTWTRLLAFDCLSANCCDPVNINCLICRPPAPTAALTDRNSPGVYCTSSTKIGGGCRRRKSSVSTSARRT